MPESSTFYAIIAAIVANGLVLLGFIVLMPRLLRRQEYRAAEEASRLREMLLDVLSEQEAVTLRQAQIGSSLSTMREQIGKLAEHEPPSLNLSADSLAEAAGMPQLQRRIEAMQGQLGSWFEQGTADQREQQLHETQNWTQLMGLLATMQDRIAVLNDAVDQQQPQASQATDRLLHEMESEMQNLRSLADEIAGLQWKLRRSVLERETSLAALRAQVLQSPRARRHRAA